MAYTGIGQTDTLRAGGRSIGYMSLDRTERAGLAGVSRLPVTLKILLEGLLRHEDGHHVTQDDVRALANRAEASAGGCEIPFRPTRVLLPESSGIPLLADLAAMRDAMLRLGGDPKRVNPLIPIDLVIDHSVTIDHAGSADALRLNMALELARNRERYAFLRWAQQAFGRFRLVPPGNGILHQVNLEVLASVVSEVSRDGRPFAVPDTLVGMDSHTPMINSMGVLGWGVGGIEAAVAMLGQPLRLQVPQVVGCRLVGRPARGVTTTDVVLTLTQRMRAQGVVGAFVEFCGPGVAGLALPQRATLSNMAVEYGASTALFPIDAETLRFLAMTGRDAAHVELVEAYARAQGLWHDPDAGQPRFDASFEFDLGAVEPSLAGPRRPEDRVALSKVKADFDAALPRIRPDAPAASGEGRGEADRSTHRLVDGDVVIAAITSCTNTSNPSVMIAAGLLARNAVARGLRAKPWVKTSLAPGSRVVTDYLANAGLQSSLDALGFQPAGYGCTTCMGNSGPLDPDVARQIESRGVVATAVLSGNRNFESRIHPLAKANYLASPPLVVAYAIAGTVRIDLNGEPLGTGSDGEPVYLRDVWPDDDAVAEVMRRALTRDLFVARYADGFSGSDAWERLDAARGDLFAWAPASDYIRRPPFFDGQTRARVPPADIVAARALLVLGDSVTTDHISPIGAIPPDSPAGRYLAARGIAPDDFSSYGARRVNHDVMIRGTFANLQLRNEMVPGVTGGWTRHMPDGEKMSVFEAATRYREAQVDTVVVAGANYGVGSSRDWAAKGTMLLGVRAVIAESFERIHRTNLVGMGVLPLEFEGGTTRRSLGLVGDETYTILGLADIAPSRRLDCRIVRPDGTAIEIPLRLRLDTATEVDWILSGGVLNHVLLALAEEDAA
ncbi:MAG: aconitate hydratase AcnA [Lautropia sp.]